MASDTAANVTEVSEDQWSTVAEESGTPLDFSEVGSQFVGVYLGSNVIQPDGWSEADAFTRHAFKGADGITYVINGGFKLNDGLAKVTPGETVRITRTPDVPMADKGKNPMKDYRIEVAGRN